MSTVPERAHAQLTQYLITLMLVSVASLAALSVIYEQDSLSAVAWAYCPMLAGSIGIGIVVWRRWRSLSQPPSWTFLIVALVILCPLVLPHLLEYCQIELEVIPQRYPLEIQLLLCLDWLGWSLLALGKWVRCLRNAAAVSLFLMLGVVALAQDSVRVWALAGYTGVGLIWMWAHHRHSWLARTPHSANISRYNTISLRKIPWNAFGISLGVSVLVFWGLGLLGKHVAGWDVVGWLASSGGSREAKWQARSGLGGGPDEVAGINARTAGLVESDHMIEDCRDSLIDVISETYGEPLKNRQMHEKMLPGDAVQVLQRRGHLPQNQTPNRDFALKRKKRREPTQPAEVRGPRALFEIQGRTPLHIRRIVYDTYDEQTHSWRESVSVSPAVVQPTGGYWLEIHRPLQVGDWYAADDYHTIKITNLADNFVPAPPLLRALKIQHASSPEYFHWQQDDVLALRERSKWPTGVILKTRMHTVDYEAVPASAWKPELSVLRTSRYGQVPEKWRVPLCELAQQWCQDLPPGWPQVQAVVTRLRCDYQLDPEATAPAEHPEPIWWFLTESRRGPDYFFASSAVLLLRSLGYPARMCLGYYAASEAYDRQTDHTPVRKHDLHFWAEVRLRDGLWVVVEPTPGYSTLPPKLPWSSWLKAQALRAWHTLLQNWPRWIAGILGLALTWALRRSLTDIVWLSCWWVVAMGSSWQRVVRTTWQILAWRARWAGIVRPAWQTPISWFQTWQHAFLSAAQEHRAFVAYLAMALYAPQTSAPDSFAEIRRVSRTLLRVGTYSLWYTLGRSKVIHQHAHSSC